MAVEARVPYHCSFLLGKEGGALRLAIAWRRVGAFDYGVYVSSDGAPAAVMFMASYSPQGQMESFLVSDRLAPAGEAWDEDHLNFKRQAPAVDPADAAVLAELSKAFCGEWLESYGASAASKLLSRLRDRGPGSGARQERSQGLAALLETALPLLVRSEKMPDILASAELTENDFLYAFLPHAGAAQGPETAALLESKMRQFFELI